MVQASDQNASWVLHTGGILVQLVGKTRADPEHNGGITYLVWKCLEPQGRAV